MNILKRLNAAMSPAAMLVAILALVVAAGGAGYAAGQIGTSGIKNNAITAKKIHKNAVTTKKIKNGAVTGAKVADRSLTPADLAKDGIYHAITFYNGGENDCLWQPGSVALPQLGRPAYRVDRFGTVHLNGVALRGNGAGGDATCDSSMAGQALDGMLGVLPPAARPKTLQYHLVDGDPFVIAGNSPVDLGSGISLPPGGIYLSTSGGTPAFLDGIVFDAAASAGATAPRVVHRSYDAKRGAQLLGLR